MESLVATSQYDVLSHLNKIRMLTKLTYHGVFPFSHHQDNFLKNCDFYSSVLTNIPNARFTVIPFNSNVVEFYKNIYSILYRILFNTISNKLQLIHRGTGIIPFFQYEIT